LGNLSTPKSVRKLQKALHAKAKAEAGYRFYALYDKISRDDILAHAYAQCRSNKRGRAAGCFSSFSRASGVARTDIDRAPLLRTARGSGTNVDSAEGFPDSRHGRVPCEPDVPTTQAECACREHPSEAKGGCAPPL
jgi:hypothetical protein